MSSQASHSRQASKCSSPTSYLLMSSSSREAMEGCGEEQDMMDQRGHRLVLPEDGYQWKKYGQKFIRNIGKVRSYFRCQRSNCSAKKRAEWSTSEPDNIRVVYEGVHSHALPAPQSGSSMPGTDSSLNANQYDLLTQVLGDRSTSSHNHGDN